MTYFEEKGFGFLRPDNGGKDIFFHISRLHQGQPTDLVPGAKVAYELGMDRNGKIAASSVRVAAAGGEEHRLRLHKRHEIKPEKRTGAPHRSACFLFGCIFGAHRSAVANPAFDPRLYRVGINRTPSGVIHRSNRLLTG